jgi:hypothetical protein
MSELLKDLIEWLFEKLAGIVKVPLAIIAKAIAIILATCIYVMCIGSYVSVPGNEIILHLGQFERCKITFGQDIHVTQIGISENNSQGIQYNHSRLVQTLDYQGSTFTVTNLWYLQQQFATNGSTTYSVIIETESSTSCEITSVSIDDEPLSLRSFFKYNLKNEKKEFVHIRYIRKELAQIIYRWNDEASNWLLTGLAAGIIMFIISLLDMELKTFISDKLFLKALEKFLNKKNLRVGSNSPKDRQIAYDRFHSHCVNRNSWFVFLQALGPALGFILTVTSLIASLDPATFSGAGTDLDSFLNGIHVAMVSTFLGLFLRLCALEAARVNLILLRRSYVVLVGNETPVDKPDQRRENLSNET